MSDMDAIIRSNFAKLLAEKNMDVAKVARAAGINRQTLARAVGGQRWRTDVIEAAARGLGVSYQDLVVSPGASDRPLVVSRDGPAALRAIATYIESLTPQQDEVDPDPLRAAVDDAINRRDFRAALRALAKLGDKWDIEDGPR